MANLEFDILLVLENTVEWRVLSEILALLLNCLETANFDFLSELLSNLFPIRIFYWKSNKLNSTTVLNNLKALLLLSQQFKIMFTLQKHFKNA